MQMVRHEAVRNNCNVFVSRRLQKLSEDDIHRFARDEDTRSLSRADRQEISMTAGVIESPESRSAFAGHTR
jgi:hypothetical protein